MWLRIDDGFPRHEKFLALSAAEVRHWLQLACGVARAESDGFITVNRAIDCTSVMKRSRLDELMGRYVEIGLIDHVPDDPRGPWRMHDWLDWNISRQDLEAQRERGRARVKKLRRKRAGAGKSVDNTVDQVARVSRRCVGERNAVTSAQKPDDEGIFPDEVARSERTELPACNGGPDPTPLTGGGSGSREGAGVGPAFEAGRPLRPVDGPRKNDEPQSARDVLERLKAKGRLTPSREGDPAGDEPSQPPPPPENGASLSAPELPRVLGVPAVMDRYGPRDRRAARRLMDEARLWAR